MRHAALALVMVLGLLVVGCDNASSPEADGGWVQDSGADTQAADAGSDALACQAAPECTASDSTGGTACKKNNTSVKDSCGRYCMKDCSGGPKPVGCFFSTAKFDPPIYCVASCDDCLP